MNTPRTLKLLSIGAGSFLLLALVIVVVGYLLVPHLYLARATFWGESDYKDLEKFPARAIHNAPPTITASTSYPRITPTPPRSRQSGTVAATAA